jgi:hypothetical protein
MTRTTNARIAGFTFLFYIAVAFPSMILLERATRGEGIAAKLASIAQHAADVRVVVVLSLLGCFSALVLAVTLYAITREVDADLAMLALTCRVAEGVISGISIPETLGLLWLATATGANAPDPGAAHALGAYLLRADMADTAMFFAVGSTLFSYLYSDRSWPLVRAHLRLVAAGFSLGATRAVYMGVLASVRDLGSREDCVQYFAFPRHAAVPLDRAGAFHHHSAERKPDGNDVSAHSGAIFQYAGSVSRAGSRRDIPRRCGAAASRSGTDLIRMLA